MPRYPVTLTVTEIKEEYPPKCPVQQVGDTLTVYNGTIEGKVCMYVLAQQMCRIYGLASGMPYPWEVMTVACPDHGKVVYELRRDPTKWWKDAMSPLTDAEVRP